MAKRGGGIDMRSLQQMAKEGGGPAGMGAKLLAGLAFLGVVASQSFYNGKYLVCNNLWPIKHSLFGNKTTESWGRHTTFPECYTHMWDTLEWFYS